MFKNVSGQKIGCQMTTIADGSNFTGSVTVYVTGDAGTQAVGSVGSGACTHEGKGYHTYAPAQAETNYDLIAFTFEGTGAYTKTVQVYTGVDAVKVGGATPETSTDIAAAVRDVSNASPAAGSLGEDISNAGAAGNPWSEVAADNNTAGTMGATLNKINRVFQ